MAKGLAKAKKKTIFRIITDINYKSQFDKNYSKGKIVESLDSYSRVIYSQTKPIWPAAARETVVLSTITPNSEGFAITATSVTHDSHPVASDPVRAKIFYSGWIIKEEFDKSCHAWFISYASPEGSIPTAVLSGLPAQSASNLDGVLTLAMQLEASGTLPKELPLPSSSSDSSSSDSSSSSTSS